MKKLLVVLLLIPIIGISQLDLKGSKIVGIGGNVGYGDLQGLTGQISLDLGKFVGNKFYLGGELTFHRRNLQKITNRQIRNGYTIINPSNSYPINHNISLGLNAKYHLANNIVRPYVGLSTGVYQTFDRYTESFITTAKLTKLYIRPMLGLTSFFAKKQQFFFDGNINLMRLSNGEVFNGFNMPSSYRLGVNIGLGLRF